VVLACAERLLDRILMRAGERRVDEIADVRMAAMHGQLVAEFDAMPDLVDVRKLEARMHALRIHVEREIDDVDVPGALAVAEEAAFDAVDAGHHREFGS